MIKTIVFDVCEVIWYHLPLRKIFYARVADYLNQDIETVMHDFEIRYPAMERDESTLLDWFKQKKANASQSDIDKILDDIYKDENFVKYFDFDVISIIKNLQKTYKVGCLSNLENYHSKYFNKHIAPLFDYAIFSCDVASRKPEPEIYQEIFKHVPCQPAEVIFTDNQESKLVTARNIGINCIHFISPEDLKNQLTTLLI